MWNDVTAGVETQTRDYRPEKSREPDSSRDSANFDTHRARFSYFSWFAVFGTGDFGTTPLRV